MYLPNNKKWTANERTNGRSELWWKTKLDRMILIALFIIFIGWNGAQCSAQSAVEINLYKIEYLFVAHQFCWVFNVAGCHKGFVFAFQLVANSASRCCHTFTCQCAWSGWNLFSVCFFRHLNRKQKRTDIILFHFNPVETVQQQANKSQ